MTFQRPDKLGSEPAPAERIELGLIGAFQMFLGDIDFDRVVGETGRIIATVELQLNKGHIQWTDGAVVFKRRVNF